MTKEQATQADYRTTLEHTTIKNADGSPARCRVNGRCKTWKTRPDDFKLPVKHGLYNCFYINQDNAEEWLLA